MTELPRYLTDKEVEEITGRKRQTLANDRHMRRGIPYVRVGRSIRYYLNDVVEFMERGRIETREL